MIAQRGRPWGLDDQLRKDCWAQIDALVREFLTEAVARRIKPLA
ncbi:hypothetical protein [Mycobacterium asiaticum]|nr:hypothetical protein [Mycobacterium asiaticum]